MIARSLDCFYGAVCLCCLLVMALFIGVGLCADDKPAVEAEVARIRQYYVEVEALRELKKEDLEFNCPSDSMEGVLTRRSRRDTGKVVRLDLGYLASDHGGSDEMYYYREGQVFFVLRADSWWQFSGKKEGETIDSLRERRFYFSKGKCIRILEKKVTAKKPELLRGQIVKAENHELDLSSVSSKEMIGKVLEKALVLPQLKDAKAVAKFFCK